MTLFIPCITLQHTATHRNTPQHSHCNTHVTAHTLHHTYNNKQVNFRAGHDVRAVFFFLNWRKTLFAQSLQTSHVTQIHKACHAYACFLTFFFWGGEGVTDQFAELDVTCELYLLNWLMTLFAKSLPIDITTRLWDNYLLVGESFMIRLGVYVCVCVCVCACVYVSVGVCMWGGRGVVVF